MELALQHITKTYQRGKVRALQDFSAIFTPGVYGLLGANGAGKSTLLNIITGNLAPDSGTMLWDQTAITGSESVYLARLGYMPQQQNLYNTFSAEQFLWYMAALKGLSTEKAKQTIPALLRTVHLEEVARRKLGAFSGGMKQRILIAQALLGDPSLLILDEPTAGLDPKERIAIRNLIGKVGQKRIVLVATHVVSDVETIAKELLFLKKGTLIRRGAIPDLLQEMENRVWSIPYQGEGEDQPMATLQLDHDARPRLRIVGTPSPRDDCRTEPPTLEDLYLFFYADEENIAHD